MKQIIAKLRDKYVREPDRVAVTASTGLAACHIEGTTLHSFAGAGLAKEPAPELVKKIKRNAKTKSRWQRTKVLIIDEVSMVDGDLYDKLETHCSCHPEQRPAVRRHSDGNHRGFFPTATGPR